MRSVEIHRKVKNALSELEKDRAFVCNNIELIAEKAGTDTRTAKRHLALLEEDGFGKFCDPKKKTFSSTKKFKELFEEKR